MKLGKRFIPENYPQQLRRQIQNPNQAEFLCLMDLEQLDLAV